MWEEVIEVDGGFVWTTWKALLADPGCLDNREKGRDDGGEVRGGAIGMNPVAELLPDDMLPDGFVQVNPGDSGSVVEAPSRGEVKGERRGGGGMEDDGVCTSKAGGTVFIGDVMAFGFGKSADFFAADDMIIGRAPPTSIPSGELLPDSLPESSESLLDEELELLEDEVDRRCRSSDLGPTVGGTPVAITGTD